MSHCIEENDVHYNPYINPCDGITNNVYDIEYNAIDLGLPSGTKWCDKNIGQNNDNPGGLIFQWGDTVGWSEYAIKTCRAKNFAIGDYKYHDGTTFTKYDGTTNLLPEDDAAVVHMGGNWCMPTIAQFQELFSNCNITTDVIDYRFIVTLTSKIEGYTDKSITIVSSGNAINYGVSNKHNEIMLWTNQPRNNNLCYAYGNSNGGSTYDSSYTQRYWGHSIRGVINS